MSFSAVDLFTILSYDQRLRIIIDEGHNLANSNANIVNVAEKLVHADRRWVVTGTPMKDLVGMEVDLAAAYDETNELDARTLRELTLEQRKHFSLKDDHQAVQSLGNIATHFLQLRPWAGSNEESADWNDYIYRHEAKSRKTYTGFSLCLRSTLEGIVVKTRPEDVARDIVLPPLTHRVVHLEPSYYDRLTANLFTLVLTANAITSERTDGDYLFHKRNGKALYALVANLRQSNFFWTGFSEAHVHAALANSRKYLAKEGISCSDSDRALLTDCMDKVEAVLTSSGWKALSKSHEIGIFLDKWPESAESWALGEGSSPLLVGISQLLKAQAHVNSQLSAPDPTEGLGPAGKTAMNSLYRYQSSDDEMDSHEAKKAPLGLPICTVNGEVTVGKRRRLSNQTTNSKKQKRTSKSETKIEKLTDDEPKTPKSKRRPTICNQELPPDSALRNTSIIGTSSSKYSYVIDQVMKHRENEKILIFYDGDNAAYYIAQALELLDVKHRIYARTLSNELRSKYVSAFDQDSSIRVLLMDVKCGALGLNLNAASRVIFINPVLRPNIEAQAIKRAHRIGQVRPVEVETLVLKGTIEEAMFQRAKAMTRQEHLDAAKALEDDQKIADIIQQARPIPVDSTDAFGYGQVAMLEQPQQLFGRPGRGEARSDDTPVKERAGTPVKPKRQTNKKRRVTEKDSNPTSAVLPSALSVATRLPQVVSGGPSSAVGNDYPSVFGGS